MSRTHILSRRSVFAFGAAALLSSASSASFAGGLPPDSPWRPRKITSSERFRLMALSDRLEEAVGKEPVLIEMQDDHLLLRVASSSIFKERDVPSEYGVRFATVLAEEISRQTLVRLEIVAHLPLSEVKFRSWIESRRRAESIKGTLESRGVSPDRLLATGLGDAFPVPSTAMPEMADGRDRIDFAFRPL
jgi:hypothetical protein